MTDQSEQSEHQSLNQGMVAWCAGNPVVAYVLLFLVFAAGLLAFNLVPIETFPKYDPGLVRVHVPYPGATPQEVEEDIVKRIEESLVGVVGIARIVSSSRDELATVDIEIDNYADPINVINNVRTSVERIEDFPPANADQPEVNRVEVTRNVLTLVVSAANLDAFGLRQVSENLRDNLLLLPGVALIELFGTRNQEIQIEASEETLRSYGLGVQDLVDVIRANSVNITGGEIWTDGGHIVMSTLAKRGFAEEFEGIVVISEPDGSLVRLADIATIRDGLLEQNIETTLDGVPAVMLHVQVEPGTSPQEVSSQVRGYLAEWQAPSGVQLQIWEDESWSVRDGINTVIQNGIYGLILVFITLALVLDLRTGVWVTIGVPVVLIGSLVFFPFLGISLNVITVFTFFILIALVVDDSIVAAESMATAREQGLNRLHGSIIGTHRVRGPLVIAALTTIAAFAALLPLEGVIGQLFATVPYVVAVVLFLSLVETFLVLPGHLARGREAKTWPISFLQDRIHKSLDDSIQNRIVALIGWSVRRPQWPPVIVLAVLIIASGVIYMGWLAWSPSLSIADDQSIQANLELPQNSSLADVHAATTSMVEAAQEINEELGGEVVDGTIVVIGQHIPLPTYTTVASQPHHDNIASVQLKLNAASERSVTKDEIRIRWRQKLSDLPIEFPTRRTRPADTVSYALIHQDESVLREAADSLRSAWHQVYGVASVEDSLTKGNRQLEVVLNETGYAAGVTPALVAAQLKDVFYGAEAQRIQRGREEVLVMIRYPSERRASYRELLNERIYLPGQNGQVPLHTIVDIHESESQANRIRIDGRTAAVLNAHIDQRAGVAADVGSYTQEVLVPQLKSSFPNLEIRRFSESREIERLTNTLLISVPIVVLIVYCLIASFLRSFIQPLLVLVGIPIAFVGVVVGHWLLGYDLTITSLFGLIAVSGVVVNDTLLLMHRYNEIRKELPDVPEIAAIAAAAQQRARPILLTSITTVIGLLPILFSQAEAIQFLIPLVVSLVFGLIFAGIGLLFLLPSILTIIELVKVRLQATSAVAEPAAS